MKTFDSLVLALLLLVPSFLVRADPPLQLPVTNAIPGVINWQVFPADSTELQLPVTNAIPGVGTNSANLDWAMDLHANVALQCVASLANIGTSNITITVQQSVNRTNWHTAATMLLAGSGTNRVSYLTNLNVGAIPWMRVSTFVNANTAAVNYLEFIVSRKRGL